MRFALCLSVFTIFHIFSSSGYTQPNAKKSDPLRTAVTITAGKFGKALDARTSPALVEGDTRFRQPPLTIECWAKLNSKKEFNILVASDSKSSSLHWEIYSFAKTGYFSAYLPGMQPSEIVSETDICDGKWHYTAMQYNGNIVRLFVDGKKVAEQTVKAKPGLGPQPGPLTIGMVLFGKNRIGCDGLIDDVRISNSIRPIKGIPQKPLILDPDTVGLWPFDSLSGFAADPAWTPRPALGNVPAWEKESDKDWVDDRLRTMDTGNFYNGTIAYPTWAGKKTAYRGTAIRFGSRGQAGALFDRNELRMSAWWLGDFLKHKNRRFGLLNTPLPAGKVFVTTASGVGIKPAKDSWKNPQTPTGPLPTTLGKYHGLYRHGRHTILSYSVGETKVLDTVGMEQPRDTPVLTRTLEIAPSSELLSILVAEPGKDLGVLLKDNHLMFVEKKGVLTHIALVSEPEKAGKLDAIGKKAVLTIPAHKDTVRVKLLMWQSKGPGSTQPASPPQSLSQFTKGGPPQWTKPITTRGKVARNDGPYVIDTISLPYDNPYKALMFCSGLDVLPNGDIAVSMVHGDVWIVSGVDDTLDKLSWKRFATGLYQPMGLKVIDGKIHVIERGQLTRLHDLNNDGEADFYENVADQWHISGGEHSFDTCLETDPQGNFYFFNGGDTNTPTGGCLLKASKDGKTVEVFSTGFRHPIGLGMSSGGIVTGADQEGNWMPSTRIDIYKKGGFYGDMRAHHRKVPPKIYDAPLCWLPRTLDNSAGGQVWINTDEFGPLSNRMLHLSYGRCRAMLIMEQKVDGEMQAGAVDLGLQFLSGIMRGRVNPNDNHLYLCGMDGWQTAAIRDGCLQRVRYTGKPAALPVSLAVRKDGIRIGFSQSLPKKIAEDVGNYRIDQWNYRWSGSYGSKRWSVKNPDKVGQDTLTVKSAKLLPDGKSVFLEVADLQPVMQMQINYDLSTRQGQTLQGAIYNTIHRLTKE